jgi:hypothetical protein
MIKIVLSVYILSSLSNLVAYCQNALLPDNCYIKYIYEFPYESQTVFYSERFPDLETRNYLNSDLIKPLFDKIFREGIQVSDPNYWGSVENIVEEGKSLPIDTSQILRYMHAGWDTTYSIDENNQITAVPVYTSPDYSDISGLFFFESWYVNPDKGFLNKEVIAYFPIYEYWDEYALEKGEQVKLKRLIFMVFQGKKDQKKIKKSMSGTTYPGCILLYRGLDSELNLYNRPYSFYLHRDQIEYGASDEEYNEWEYHTFDFYRDFNAEVFLKTIISLTLDGKFKAEDPVIQGKNLTEQEILEKVSGNQEPNYKETGQHQLKTDLIRYDNLNSVVFNEDWYFNPGSLCIMKKVNSITIFKHEYQYDEYTGDFLRVLKTPLFIVSLH